MDAESHAGAGAVAGAAQQGIVRFRGGVVGDGGHGGLRWNRGCPQYRNGAWAGAIGV